MNYYERIQRSIDFIERNLTEGITLENCANEAYMSLSGYHRLFLSLVGYNVKEYIRRRRLSEALKELCLKGETVLDTAVKYGYGSVDGFARAFKKQFGVVPSKARDLSSTIDRFFFGRVNIVEKLFEQNAASLEHYPDIKVIRELPPMKVACFTYFGDAPEDHSFDVLKKWAKEHDVVLHGQGYRVFGYNHPDPSDVDADETYGYEFCVTVPDELYETLPDVPEGFVKGTYDGVKRRMLTGGKYAVMSVRRNEQGDLGGEIMKAWKRFSQWLDESRYIWGGNQYLEEHRGFAGEDEHVGGVDLYISIQDAP